MRPDTETAAEAAERRVDMLSRYESGGGGHAESVLTSVPIVDAFCVGLARDRNDSTTAAAPAQEREVVCILGSGNWGSAIARIVGMNAERDRRFSPTVNMWVYEEVVNGRKLTSIINTVHENVKYLPGVKLPPNVVAVADPIDAVRGATLLVFVLPHQFVMGLCRQLKGHLRPGCRAISLIKGIDVSHGLHLMSEVIRDSLAIDVSVLMGANVADEVARDQFCETTIGYNQVAHAEIFRDLFATPNFRVNIIDDVAGPELCGALKNIVALAAGFVDGLRLGGNTKAAVMRIGLMEMKRFAETFHGGIKPQTFLESCGVGDLITTCYNGRNHRVAVEVVRTGKTFDQLEVELLHGQKLQGTLTAAEVYHFLQERNALDKFPLFHVVYQISFEHVPPSELLKRL